MIPFLASMAVLTVLCLGVGWAAVWAFNRVADHVAGHSGSIGDER